jgi:hydrogenase/urease accessory protein HupE
MNRAIYLGLALVSLALGSTAASAHPGDHAGFGWTSLAAHLVEPDHLVLITLIVLVGILAFRMGRRAERRARQRRTP